MCIKEASYELRKNNYELRMLNNKGGGNPAIVYCDKTTNLITKTLFALRRKTPFQSVSEFVHLEIKENQYRTNVKGFEKGEACPVQGVATKVDYIFDL